MPSRIFSMLRSAGVVVLVFPLVAAIAVRGFAPPSSPSAVVDFGGGARPRRAVGSTAFRRRGVVFDVDVDGDATVRGGPTAASTTTMAMAASRREDGEDDPGPGGMKEGAAVSTKLLAETIAPFRGLRLFFYAALASGAFAGGLISLSGIVAASNGLRPDVVDLDAEYVNLAIDFGAATALGALAKFDLDRGAELNEAVEEKVRRKGEVKKLAKATREREAILGGLSVSVRVSTDGETREATISAVQMGARQHVILVAGPGRAVRDALRGAQLNKANFPTTNVLVVPYETGIDVVDRATRPDGKGGFGGGDVRPSYETQPYVAEPVGGGWDDFVNAEMDAAVVQAGEGAREEGIALVVANDGRVLRRGVGKVPWRRMVDELEEAVTGEKKKETSVPFLEFLE